MSNFTATQPASADTSNRSLIESDRVEGTSVYGSDNSHIGSIKRLMIDKKSGQVAYAVMSFGGFLGLGEDSYTVPWGKLDYSTAAATRPTSRPRASRARPTSTATRTTPGATATRSDACTTITACRPIGGSERLRHPRMTTSRHPG